jgi:hypothetical protein
MTRQDARPCPRDELREYTPVPGDPCAPNGLPSPLHDPARGAVANQNPFPVPGHSDVEPHEDTLAAGLLFHALDPGAVAIEHPLPAPQQLHLGTRRRVVTGRTGRIRPSQAERQVSGVIGPRPQIARKSLKRAIKKQSLRMNDLRAANARAETELYTRSMMLLLFASTNARMSQPARPAFPAVMMEV